MDNVRVGVIGIGGMGSSHARKLNDGSVTGATLAAVCDVNPARLKWAADSLHSEVQKFASASELFAANCVDAVLIATPHYDHPPLAIEAFSHGLHVLSEKPAGVYTKQVQEMNAAAEASGKVFGLMLNLRTTGVYQKFKELIEAGELGETVRTNWIITNWFRSQSYYDSGGWRASWQGEGGGVLLNQCPHNLDLWQWICGMPKRVRAFCSFGKYHNIEVEDDVTAYVEYENGATGVFITTTGEAPGTNRLEVSGDRGKIVMENGQLHFFRTRKSVSEFNRTFTGGFGTPESWKCEIPTGAAGEQHLGIMKNWVNAIRTGSKLLAPGVDGINSLTLSNAMLLSAWTDSWVDLPIDADVFYRHLQERIQSSRYQKNASGKTLAVDGSFGS